MSASGPDVRIRCTGTVTPDEIHLGNTNMGNLFGDDAAELASLVNLIKGANIMLVDLRNSADPNNMFTFAISNVISPGETPGFSGNIILVGETSSTIANKGNLFSGTGQVHVPLHLENHAEIETSGIGSSAIEVLGEGDVEVTNFGRLTTSGVGALGMRATADYRSTIDDLGKVVARAENRGTINVTGGAENSDFRTFGILVEARKGINDIGDSTTRINYMDAEAVNSGDISVTGEHSVGIRAYAQEYGNVIIRVTGGRVIAGSTGKRGAGLHGWVGNIPSDDSDSDIDVDILVRGSNTIIESHNNSLLTARGAIRVYVADASFSASPNAYSRVRILNGATVTAYDATGNGYDDAVLFVLTKGLLELAGGSQINGNVAFAGYADRFDFRGGKVMGDIDFGAGDDDFDINTSARSNHVSGTVSNVERITLGGGGVMRLASVVSTAPTAMNIENGNLVITGEMNLGAGTATVKRPGRLSFEIGDITTNSANHGKLIANTLVFEGAPQMFAQLAPDLTDEQVTAVRNALPAIDAVNGLPVLDVTVITHNNGDTFTDAKFTVKSEDRSSNITDVGEVTVSDGEARFFSDRTGPISKLNLTDPVRQSGSGAGSGGSGAIGIGLLAALLVIFAADDDEPDEAQLAGDAPDWQGARHYLADSDQAGLWVKAANTGLNHSMRQRLGSRISGNTIGMTLYQNDNWYVDTALIANMSADSTATHVSARGETYRIGAGIRTQRWFAGLGFSQGEFEASSSFADHTAGGMLSGESDFTARQSYLHAGTHVEAGSLRLTPSATWATGSIRQSAYEADNAVMTARVPGYEQRYSATRLGLKMTSSKWLELSGGTKVAPYADLSVMQTKSDRIEGLKLEQQDRLGVLNYSTGVGVRGLPESLSALTFGTDVKPAGDQSGSWRFGFAAMNADGDYDYAALAGYRLRF